MNKYFVVVAYDVPNNRRRAQLHKRLLDYGTPVQYSVFECLVSEEEMERMRGAVRNIIKPRLDNVRYYRLCAACQRQIETTSAGPERAEERDVWVV